MNRDLMCGYINLKLSVLPYILRLTTRGWRVMFLGTIDQDAFINLATEVAAYNNITNVNLKRNISIIKDKNYMDNSEKLRCS